MAAKLQLFLLSLFLLMQGCSNAKTISLVSIPLAFDHRIKCTYKHGTTIFQPAKGPHTRTKEDSNKATLQIVDNHSDMVWDFFDLLSDKPFLISDGDTVPLTTYRVKDSFGEGGGIVAVFPQGNGVQMFVLWANGISYWAKHNHIVGSRTSSFVGQCVNL